MHERLKFKIDLSEERGQHQDWGYQPVFSEEQYGTHYVINARFEGTQGTGGALNLDNIHFYLQNYTGGVTVGLENLSFVEECTTRYPYLVEPFYPESKVYKITLFARGFNTNLRHSHQITDTLNVIKPGDILVTEVAYLPITKKLTFWDDSASYNQAPYVDPIYQDRDGEDVTPTKRGAARIDHLISHGFNESDDGTLDFGTFTGFGEVGIIGPSRNCKASVSIAI